MRFLSATLTATAPILRRERILNLPTEVVRVEGPGVCNRHIIFVPGNPGVAAYYQEVAELLTKELNATAAIVGLRGHTEPPAPDRFYRTFSLDEQVDHVSAFIESEARDLDDDKQLVMIGHSIGAYIGLEALARVRPKRLAAAVGIMPYLESTDQPETKKLAGLATSWWFPLAAYVVAALAQLIGWLPPGLRRWLVAKVEPKFPSFEPEQAALTLRAMPQLPLLLNVLFLFRSEAFHHAAPYDHAKRLRGFKERVGLFFTDKEGDVTVDHWAPPCRARKGEAAGLQVRVEPGLPHAFGTSAASRSRVTKAVAEMVESLSGASSCEGMTAQTA